MTHHFPDSMLLFRLRQAFEVCGILSDVYVSRYRNARGQEFGFIRYVNIKYTDKLSQAVNNVWIGECRVWEREARFDRFAHNDVSSMVSSIAVKEEEGKRRVVVCRLVREKKKKVRWGNLNKEDGGE